MSAVVAVPLAAIEAAALDQVLPSFCTGERLVMSEAADRTGQCEPVSNAAVLPLAEVCDALESGRSRRL